jgi:hypothetical protein
MCCLVIFILTHNMYATFISFGTIGLIISLFIYRYYQHIEYYFYLNAGLSKRGMIAKVFKINITISIILTIVLWGIH